MKKTKGSTASWRKTVGKKWTARIETPENQNAETYSQHMRHVQSKRKTTGGKPTDRYSQDWLSIENYEQFR